MLSKATKVRMQLSDDSGYKFNIDAEESFTQIRTGINAEVVREYSDGWSGTLTLAPRGRLKKIEALLPTFLVEAKHLVRMLEEELKEAPKLTRTSEMETFYDLCVSYGNDLAKYAFKPGLFDNSRDVMDVILDWANEFNRLNANTDWAEVEYLDAIDLFWEEKVKDVREEAK